MQVDHLIIGAGVVGLSIAAQLAKRYPEKSTFLVERHRRAGEETSSRNSEVIHAGLYYPSDSLKTQMCIRGREAMYRRCEEWGIGFKQTGKLVVGPEGSKEYFEKMKEHCEGLGPLAPPLRLLSGDEAREMEPDLSKEIAWAMLSERTGIVSSHEFMESFEREIMDSENAELVYDTQVVRIDPHLPSKSGSASSGKRGSDNSQEGWIVQTKTMSEASMTGSDEGDSDSILARVVINSSGLNGHLALNAIRGDKRFADGDTANEPMSMWYAKGNYVSYKGPGVKNVKRLIYPVPATTSGSHSHQSLGTHLTLDLNGGIKFGPDTEWLSPPDPNSSIDFWAKQLAPVTSDERMHEIYESITSYLPDISLEGLAPDYAGIRPKLIPPGGGFMDFTILKHHSRELNTQKLWQYANLPRFSDLPRDLTNHHRGPTASRDGSGGSLYTLAGIESPGLTSSVALGELVSDMVAEQVWGHGDATKKAKKTGKEREIPKGARNDEVGGSLDAWA